MATRRSKSHTSRTTKATVQRYHLETLSSEGVIKSKAFGDRMGQLYWQLYCELAHQRSLANDAIKQWIASVTTGPYSFTHWRRVVPYQFSDDPLSTVGSIRSVGGRFNIGDIDLAKFPGFPALYVASNQATSLAEAFGEITDQKSKLTALDLALSSEKPYACVSVSGQLDEIIDIRNQKALKGLHEINKTFSVSKGLISDFKKAGLGPVTIPATSSQLLASIMIKNWRIHPMQYDVPSNSQLLGQIASASGLQGILYQSTKHAGECLVIYLQNFPATNSFVALDGDAPKSVIRRRIDSKLK